LGELPTAGQLPLSFEEPGDGIEVHRFRSPVEPLPPVEPDLVYVSFGTVSASVPFAARAFRTVVEELASLPIRLLVTIGDGGDPAEWTWTPPNVRVERWVPQGEALRGVAACVTHGGMGSVLGSLTAGVPVVVVPQFADQPDNGTRVEALGAGLCVRAEDVRAAVLRVLEEPSFRESAGRVAAEIAALPEAGEVLELR
jgi:MGT family glycosyltransferase